MTDPDDPTLVRIVTIICLAAIILATVIVLGFVAVLTDRDLFRVEVMTFAGVVLLCALGGISWYQLRRHHWRVNIDRNGQSDQHPPVESNG